MSFKIKLGRPGLPTKKFVLLCTGVFFILFLYFWRLGTLTPGMSEAEVAARTSSSTIGAIIENPAYAPHKLVQFIFQSFDQSGAFWMRLPSAVFVVLVLFAFYVLLKGLFGRFISFLGVLFLAATPLIITLARSATPEIMLLFPVLIFSCFNYLSRTQKQSRRENLIWLSLILLIATSLYVPLMAWILIIGLIFFGRHFIKLSAKMTPVMLLLGGFIFLAIVAPLVFAVVEKPSIIKTLLAIPNSWLSPIDLLNSLAWSILALIWRTPQHIPYIVGRLPIFDIAQVTLAGIGLFALFKKLRRGTALLLTYIFLSLVMTAVNKNLLLLTLTIPVVSFFVAAGLRFMYVKWFSVFPRNPLPRALAIILMSLLVIFQIAYGVRYALVAWPNASDTKKIYVLK